MSRAKPAIVVPFSTSVDTCEGWSFTVGFGLGFRPSAVAFARGAWVTSGLTNELTASWIADAGAISSALYGPYGWSSLGLMELRNKCPACR